MAESLRDVYTRWDAAQILIGVILTQLAIFGSPTKTLPPETGGLGFILVVAVIFVTMEKLQVVEEAQRILYYVVASAAGAAFLNFMFYTKMPIETFQSGVFSTTAGLAIIVGVIGAFTLDVLEAI